MAEDPSDKLLFEANERIAELEEILKSRHDTVAQDLADLRKAVAPLMHLGQPGETSINETLTRVMKHYVHLLQQDKFVRDLLLPVQSKGETSMLMTLGRVLAQFKELQEMPGIVNEVQKELSEWHTNGLRWYAELEALKKLQPAWERMQEVFIGFMEFASKYFKHRDACAFMKDTLAACDCGRDHVLVHVRREIPGYVPPKAAFTADADMVTTGDWIQYVELLGRILARDKNTATLSEIANDHTRDGVANKLSFYLRADIIQQMEARSLVGKPVDFVEEHFLKKTANASRAQG